jgi:hypothetical protein
MLVKVAVYVPGLEFEGMIVIGREVMVTVTGGSTSPKQLLVALDPGLGAAANAAPFAPSLVTCTQ